MTYGLQLRLCQVVALGLGRAFRRLPHASLAMQLLQTQLLLRTVPNNNNRPHNLRTLVVEGRSLIAMKTPFRNTQTRMRQQQLSRRLSQPQLNHHRRPLRQLVPRNLTQNLSPTVDKTFLFLLTMVSAFHQLQISQSTLHAQ